MKKILILACILLMVPAVASFAADTGSQATNVYTVTAQTSDPVTGIFDVKLSKNVQMHYLAFTSGAGYSVSTYHTSGTRSYGSSSGDAAIFYIEGTNATTPTAPTGTASADFSSWLAL